MPASYSVPAAWDLSGAIHGTPGVANGPVVTTDFTLWQQLNFSSADLANPLRSGLLADPDGDGGSNLLEMALVTAPLDANSRPAPTVALTGADVIFTFTRLRQALDIVFSVEESDYLIVWSLVSFPIEVTSQTDAVETVRVVLPQEAAAKKFVRLRVTN